MRTGLLFFLLCCGALSTRGAVITLTADRDASLFKSPGDNSNGGGPGIFTGVTGLGFARRGLIAFDLSSIPAGSIISDVQLTLTVGQAPSGAAATIGLYQMTSSWTEGSNAPSSMIAMTGNGQPAQTGDSTWNSRAYSASGSTPWNTPGGGGDFDNAVSGSLTISDSTLNASHTWLSTPALVADVQQWLDVASTNQGWLLMSADETAAAAMTIFGFYSSEWTDPVYRPKLQITYIPEPATAGLLAFGLLPLLAGRHRKDGRLQGQRITRIGTNEQCGLLQ